MVAQWGYRVVVVEQREFPREHVGESLSRGAWPLLSSLGIPRGAVESVGVPVRAASVRWHSGSDEPAQPGGGLTVDRGRFDDLLLNHAHAAGTVVRRGRARRPERTATGWRVSFGSDAVEARFLADATGRFALLGGRRTITSARTLALHARWPASQSRLPDTSICALPDGWLWCARLPGGDLRTIILVDPALLAAEPTGPDRLFKRLLESAGVFEGLLGTMPRSTVVKVCDASSYRFDEVVTFDAIRLGEAAFAIDPLSSSGVQTAIQTGLAAAATVHTLLSPGGDRTAALEYYGDLVATSATHHLRTAARAYADNVAYADREFWRRRSVDAERAPAQRTPIDVAGLLPRRVRLRDTAEFRALACRVGDRIERRPALCSRHLDRPVGFLDGIPLAPLIEELESGQTLGAVLGAWERTMPPSCGSRILSWLLYHDLLEAA